MYPSHRKTAPRVVGGRQMRKNRHELTRGLVDPTRGYPIVVRERPLHELGHHHDRMTTRTRTASARGEPYAESFASERMRAVWDRYARANPND